MFLKAEKIYNFCIYIYFLFSEIKKSIQNFYFLLQFFVLLAPSPWFNADCGPAPYFSFYHAHIHHLHTTLIHFNIFIDICRSIKFTEKSADTLYSLCTLNIYIYFMTFIICVTLITGVYFIALAKKKMDVVWIEVSKCKVSNNA